MNKSIREQLIELSDPNFLKFTSSLLPGTEKILGVRLPLLRKMAKKIAKDDWREYLKTAEDEYYEEVMLQGMVIGYSKTDLGEHLSFVKGFIPKINNWSVCDSFVSGLKFTKDNKEQVWNFLQPYFNSSREYDVRFAVVMLIFYYMTIDDTLPAFQLFNRIRLEGYYVRMAVAWAVSIYYISFPEVTLKYLLNNDLDDFTFNKSLQKITESNIPDEEDKKRIRLLKR